MVMIVFVSPKRSCEILYVVLFYAANFMFTLVLLLIGYTVPRIFIRFSAIFEFLSKQCHLDFEIDQIVCYIDYRFSMRVVIKLPQLM